MEYEALTTKKEQETSAQIRERVCRVREIQRERYRNQKFLTNSMLQVKDLNQYCGLDKEGERLMRHAFDTMNLTARTYHKILKVARTIADMDGQEQIAAVHLKEAIGYRTLDKKYWGR